MILKIGCVVNLLKDTIGLNLRRIRKLRGHTLKTLSEQTGLSFGYISKIENGRNLPSIEAMEKISDVLETEIYFFFLPNNEENVERLYEWSTLLEDFVARGITPHDVREAIEAIDKAYSILIKQKANVK